MTLLVSAAAAKTIDSSCLVLSQERSGVVAGEPMSNMNQLTDSVISDDMRLHSITTCLSDVNSVTGVQFTLAENPYDEVPENLFHLSSIGRMTGVCDTVQLPFALDKIKVSTQSADTAPTSIRYDIYGALKQTYGDLDHEYTRWHFTE